MDTLQKLMPSALQTLATPTETPPISTAVSRYFDGFILAGGETKAEEEKLGQMRAACERWCSDFLLNQNPRWLSLVGWSGAGKTFLAECIWKFLREHAENTYRKTVYLKQDTRKSDVNLIWSYAQEGGMLVRFRPLMKALREQKYSQLHRTCNDFVKVVDDFGSDMMKADKVGEEPKPTAYCVGVCGDIADARVGKWTVLTSNFMKSQIATLFDVRIASRMLRGGSEVIECKVRDFNLRREQSMPQRA